MVLLKTTKAHAIDNASGPNQNSQLMRRCIIHTVKATSGAMDKDFSDSVRAPKTAREATTEGHTRR